MCQEIAGVCLAVYFHTLDVTVLPISLVRLDQHLLSVIQMEFYGFEQRSSQHILIRARAYGIKA